MLVYESVPSVTVRVQTQKTYLLVISENVSQKAMDKGKKDWLKAITKQPTIKIEAYNDLILPQNSGELSIRTVSNNKASIHCSARGQDHFFGPVGLLYLWTDRVLSTSTFWSSEPSQSESEILCGKWFTHFPFLLSNLWLVLFCYLLSSFCGTVLIPRQEQWSWIQFVIGWVLLHPIPQLVTCDVLDTHACLWFLLQLCSALL